MSEQVLNWIETKNEDTELSNLPMEGITVLCALFRDGFEHFFTAYTVFSGGAIFNSILPDESESTEIPIKDVHKWAYLNVKHSTVITY